MPGGGDPFGGGVQVTDESRGTFLPGVTEGTGPVQGVRGVYGGGIFGEAYVDTAWARVRRDMEL